MHGLPGGWPALRPVHHPLSRPDHASHVPAPREQPTGALQDICKGIGSSEPETQKSFVLWEVKT